MIFPATTRQTTAFNTMKRTSTLLNSARAKVSPIGIQASRAYSSEMANALVQVSQNIGMGNAAIGLGGKSRFFITSHHTLSHHTRLGGKAPERRQHHQTSLHLMLHHEA